MAFLADIPKFAFGTAYDIGTGRAQMSETQFSHLLEMAIDMGCRHIDCAPLYGTQTYVGQVINKVISNGFQRDRLFITSKLPINMMSTDNIDRSLTKTLAELQLTYLDLFLVHAPFATRHVADDLMLPTDSQGNLLLDESDQILESAWQKLAELKAKKLVRYIGLSNVNIEQVTRLNKIHQIDVVQNEYHLFNQDREMLDFCDEIDIHFEAYSAMGCPPRAQELNKPTFLEDETVERIACASGLTKAEVIIQWLHNQPISYVVRSDNQEQLKENLGAINKSTLSVNDMIDLDSLNKNARLYYYDTYKGILKHREYPF